jgi:hypothetical protein
MRLDEAIKLFKDRYTQVGLTLVEEHLDKLVFSRGESKWIVDSADLNEYIGHQAHFSDFETKPNECSICSKSYFEQAVIGNSLPFSETDIVFGDPQSGSPFAVLKKPSPQFLAYFRFRPDFTEWTTRRLRDTLIARRKNDTRIIDKMPSIFTIQVEKIEANSIDEAVKIANNIITGCLFQLAAIKGLPQRARMKWPKLNVSGHGQEKEDEEDGPLQMLKVNPIRDLVNLYTLGTYTNFPQFQFLAYYHVLEYFFIKISDEQLYAKLTRSINDLSFRCTPDHLDRLIQDVSSHNRESDETKLLENVLKKYIREDELTNFISEFEKQVGGPQYTKKRKLFGKDVQITFHPEQLFGTTAKTIKTVRNALVHSTDRYEREERYMPFSGSEEIIAREIPLMKYLAEKVIIASATPIA